MADSLWNLVSSGGVKRPRSDYDLPASGLYSGHEMHSYLAQDDDLGGPRAVKDTKSIGSAYDRYLQNGQMSSDTIVGVGLGRPVGGGMADHSLKGCPGAVTLDLISGDRNINLALLPVDAMPRLGPGCETAPLPPDATNTLYIEGLPSDSMKREVAPCAATAMSALQGYKMDEHNPDSNYLRLQFSRFPGPRSGHGSRSKK